MRVHRQGGAKSNRARLALGNDPSAPACGGGVGQSCRGLALGKSRSNPRRRACRGHRQGNLIVWTIRSAVVLAAPPGRPPTCSVVPREGEGESEERSLPSVPRQMARQGGHRRREAGHAAVVRGSEQCRDLRQTPPVGGTLRGGDHGDHPCGGCNRWGRESRPRYGRSSCRSGQGRGGRPGHQVRGSWCEHHPWRGS